MTSRSVCVLNAGSSSLKFALYRVAPEGTLIRALSGEVERIGGQGRVGARHGLLDDEHHHE